MATLNTRRTPTVRTHEGAPARRTDPETQLRRTVMACLLWERQFYEDGVSIADRICEGVAAVAPDVAAAIAVEAREVMHLRHVPLLIVRELARKGGRIVGDTLARVIQRPDELTEFLAIYWAEGRIPLSAQVKRGLAEAFGTFDAHRLAKYDRPKAVRLRDVLFLCHAKPKDAEQAAVWARLIDGTLPAPDTWEVALSAGKDKRVTWERLLTEGQLGGLALLRNLRNMAQAGVPEATVRAAIAANPFHRVLPFRFIAAARYAPALEDALEAAMFRGLVDAPTLAGKTTILVDCSGSMGAQLSERSDMTRLDAACGLAVLLREICDAVDVVAFSAPTTHTGVARAWEFPEWHMDASKPGAAVVAPRRGFALAEAIVAATARGGTNTEDGKRLCDDRGYDRLVIITDEQSHQAISGPKGRGYLVNVASYQYGIGYGEWTTINGWSEAIVRYIQEAERATGSAA